MGHRLFRHGTERALITTFSRIKRRAHSGTSGADRPPVTRDSQTRASPPDWIPGQPRANHTADGEYDENAAAQGMTRREEHDADHDKRRGRGEQDHGEGADAAHISCRHCDGRIAAGSRAARRRAAAGLRALRPGSAEGRRRPANGARRGVRCGLGAMIRTRERPRPNGGRTRVAPGDAAYRIGSLEFSRPSRETTVSTGTVLPKVVGGELHG